MAEHSRCRFCHYIHSSVPIKASRRFSRFLSWKFYYNANVAHVVATTTATVVSVRPSVRLRRGSPVFPFVCPCALLSRNMCSSSIVLLSVLMCALYVAGRVHLMRVVGWKNTIRSVLCRSLFDGLMPDYDRITVALRIPYSRQSDSTPTPPPRPSSTSYSIAAGWRSWQRNERQWTHTRGRG